MIAKNNNGNVLFLILIAVVLFSALSYAITSSSKGGGSVDKEQNLIHAAQITQAGAGLAVAVQKMVMFGTIAANLDLDTGDNETECTTGVDCVFAAEGGDQLEPYFPSAAQGTPFYQELSVGKSISNVGTTAAEILWGVDNISLSLCQQINKGLGFQVSPVPEDTNDSNTIQGEASEFSGEYAFCEDATTGAGTYYIYWHVLLAQ